MHHQEIYLAGGCFWGVEAYFAQLDGILKAESGYANGNTANPTYEEVVHQNTGHAEVVRLTYDPSRISLPQILQHFFRLIDPTTLNRQGNDYGTQYRSGIYSNNQHDQALIAAALIELQSSYQQPVVVENLPLENFYLAETYHQQYLIKNPKGYCHIDLNLAQQPLKTTTNTPLFLAETYQQPPLETLNKILTPAQLAITKHNGTERPFSHIYNSNFQAGIYVDLISGEPLFNALDKYDAGCGWPSFTKPIQTEHLVAVQDSSHGMQRTEIRSKFANSHLGHVFPDGPIEQGGLRYCINGHSLVFIPLAEMAAKGYGAWVAQATPK